MKSRRPESTAWIRAGGAALILALLVCGVFRQATEFAFVAWDDDHYVTKNPRVLAGLTVTGAAWAFTSFDASNWHPLTWLSHMLDVQLYGADPAGHHRTSLLLHLAAVLLLFLVLRRYTGATWSCFVVAGLFAIHPQRAESVAWVAERKDVLSTVLWVTALAAYLWYVRFPRPARLVPLCALFAAGLAAKPMLVSLPFVLLLLDWWPLGRFVGPRAAGGRPRGPLPLIVEKIPLFLLSAGSAAITLLAQRRGGALLTLEAHSAPSRLGNAVVSFVGYLGDLLWPDRLAFFYPFREYGLLSWQVVGAAGLLALLTFLALFFARRLPFLVTGWFWYLGTLVPVVGIVQVGMQAAADRYSYLPSVGIGIALVWAVGEWGGSSRPLRVLKAVAAAATLLVLAAAAWRQAGTWKDTETMARHALSVTERNWMAHFLLGNALAARGQRPEATAHLEESVRLNPDHADAWSNLGGLLAAQGRFEEAEQALRQAVRIRPDLAAARFNLGFRLLRRGDLAGAREQYEALRKLDPAVAESLRRFLAAAP